MSRPNQERKIVRVLLVDDHAVVRAGLRMLIESHGQFEVMGEASNGKEALAIAAREQPDIVLLDLDLGGESGLDLISGLHASAAAARVILLTGIRDPEQHQEGVRRGAMGVVLKEQAAQVLLNAIERVHAGEVWLDSSLVANVLSSIARQRPAPRDPEADRLDLLTERECEVISLVCKGLSNKQVARQLQITETTVSHHLGSIFGKLNLSSRLELVIYAYQHGLAEVPGKGPSRG